MSSIPQAKETPSTALKPPQFRLRTMLAGVSVICVLLVMMVAVGMAWAMGLLMLVLLIMAHVIGNSLGTQLRDYGSRAASDLTAAESVALQSAHSRTLSSAWQPPTAGRMQEKRPVGWLLMGVSLCGSIASGVVGGLAISSLYWEQIGVTAISIAALASGVMGGMAVFLTGMFIDMAQRVLREATAENRPAKREW